MAEFSKIFRYYGCHNCGNLISRHDDIVSKYFQGVRGRAFLFSQAANLVEGPKEDRILITGLHTVSDVFCIDCGENLGWKYERTYHDSEKYKEGKYVLERLKIAEVGS
ncbi:hypothetical protein MLD38_036326 [Melastoma candidum]|uniref:Uncharacterized protein n=1 Tax=Melastoma candidum TaxID=119954 RepID=A0ACB9LKJ0_9MYRT|nr:hypothetical protein MLD38_036326 [Melastoma candidum]